MFLRKHGEAHLEDERGVGGLLFPQVLEIGAEEEGDEHTSLSK